LILLASCTTACIAQTLPAHAKIEIPTIADTEKITFCEGHGTSQTNGFIESRALLPISACDPKLGRKTPALSDYEQKPTAHLTSSSSYGKFNRWHRSNLSQLWLSNSLPFAAFSCARSMGPGCSGYRVEAGAYNKRACKSTTSESKRLETVGLAVVRLSTDIL
jgi:hypothetical protein